jgi:hypothetical protein
MIAHLFKNIVVLLFTNGGVAFVDFPTADQLTNAMILASMPVGTESVIIWRLDQLSRETSVFRRHFEQEPGLLKGNDIRTICHNAVAAATQRVFALGGSEFALPSTTGMTGNYNERAIHVVEKPLDALLERLLGGGTIEGRKEVLEFEGTALFRGRIPPESPWARTKGCANEEWFVSILGRHILVSAESRADIEYMIGSLRQGRSAIPPHFADIPALHNVESPVLVVRNYPAVSEKSECFAPSEIPDLRRLVLSVPSVEDSRQHVSLWTGRPREVAGLLLFSDPYRWQPQGRTESRVDALIVAEPPRATPEHLLMIWLIVFGACIAI